MRTVLALNAGSATLKFALYAAEGLRIQARGLVDRWGGAGQRLAVSGEQALDAPLPDGREAAVRFLFDWIGETWPRARLTAIGHRIVHGGAGHDGPVAVTPDVVRGLEALSPLAPLHQPDGLTGLRLAQLARPEALQVASFDTAFHRTMPPVATRFALPREYEAQGVRRYGFHGLSYAHVAERLRDVAPDLAAGRVIVAHLGGGASLCAMQAGRSVDTTMGFSALDGLVMNTRCGAIDPGVLLHLLQAQAMTPEDLSDLLYRRSGLLGVSDVSGDMRALLASPEPAAAEALELYVYRILRETGALASVMGGLDGLVFTAGVGENSAEVRQAVCAGLGWLGVRLDRSDGAGERRIGRIGVHGGVWVIPTDEERVIAREALAIADAAGPAAP